MSRQPALFVSHGAPTLAIEDSPARRFLASYGRTLGRPEAVLVASAHWTTAAPSVGAAERPATIHDFRGFPPALHAMTYPAPGAPEVGREAARLLEGAGFVPALDERRGLDHGAWVPLSLLFPEADVPVAQVSIQPHLGPRHHADLGAALRPLRDRGVLVLGSGSLTHNLAEFRGQATDAAPPDWVTSFGAWIRSAIEDGRSQDLIAYRGRAPDAARNHPTDEHLLPLFLALGAGGAGPGRRIHASHSYGVLAMDAYAFDDAAA